MVSDDVSHAADVTAADPATVDAQTLVDMRGITKRYPGVIANDGVDLTLAVGRVHALLGENGAGKSTLVKVLYGLLQADEGCVVWKGQDVQIRNPAEARKLGIAMVFQHFSLFESMTVLENIALGMAVDADASLASRIVDVSTRYGLPLDPAQEVHTLSVGARQRIEICRCLLQEPALLIMDEPTSVLTPQEVGELFETLRRLADEGTAILYISHKLDEIRQLCHEATILRHGRKVASADPARESASGLAALMMGVDNADKATGILIAADQVPELVPDEATEDALEGMTGREAEGTPEGTALSSMSNDSPPDGSAPPRLALVGAGHPAARGQGTPLIDVSLTVNAFEIVGIAGVAGNGQDELLGIIAGEIRLADASLIQLDGNGIGELGAGKRRQLGLGVVPEERLGHAAVPSMSLAENAFLTAHHRRPLRRAGLLSLGASRRMAEEIIERFDVRCNGAGSLASSLSGGNLQKFVVGREILQAPTVLVVSQPTWGVDAGAAAVIHDALRSLAAAGAAVLVVSQDLDELMVLSDRIGALCAGRLSALHATSSVTVRDVGLLMGGEALSA